MSFISDIANFKPPAKNFGRMAILAIIIAILYFISGAVSPFWSQLFPLSESQKDKQVFIDNLRFDYKVVGVVDGDTIDIERLDGEKVFNIDKIVRVRLLGINTPETVDPRRPGECFGKEASNYLKNLADGKIAAVELDDSQGFLDKYGRVLAYIYIKDSGFQKDNILFVNKEEIKDGYAYEYTYNTPYKYQEEFKYMESFARQKYMGLWSPETCNGLKSPVAPPNDNTVNTINPYKNN
ncbi:MAG: micrococcal nuclease [Patescibacteria group bacterium]|nr:micrococcal nuclease [Patescibacteria group bacterium]